MSDLRDRLTQALYEPVDPLVAESAFGPLARNDAAQRARERVDAIMPIVEELAADLVHAERENRRLTAKLNRK